MEQLQLQYKKTFIDCGDASAADTPRSKSLPPKNSAIVLTEDERWRNHYVEGLKERVSDEFEWPSEEVEWTSGSLGHPELCGKPCIRFYFGNCTKGLQCQFCHLEHDEPKRKLDKVQRRNLDNLSEPEVISLLLHQLQTRSRQQGLTDQLILVLACLRREVRIWRLNDRQFASNEARLNRELRATFANVFKKLSVARLLDLLKNHPAVSQDLKDQVLGLLASAASSGSP